MKLIKKITVEPRKVKDGQPFKIKVFLNAIPDKEIYVQINGHWGTQQILQFDGLPGDRTVHIRAFTDDKHVFDFRKVKVTLLPEQQSANRGMIQPEVHLQMPNVLRLTLLRAPLKPPPADVFYEWHLNGEKMTTQPTPEGFFDLSSQMNHGQMFTEFEVKLVERKADGTTSAKYRQYVSLASSYHLIKKQAGILMPPVENNFLLDVIHGGYIYFNLLVQNVEKYPLTFTKIQYEFLNNDPDAVNVFLEEALDAPFTVPAASKSQYDNALKAAKLPPGTGGFIIRLLGASETGIPAKSVAHFEFALQMRHQSFDLSDKLQVNRWLWLERPWEIVLRKLAKDYFVNIPAVQNGTADIKLLKRLYSMNFEGVKKHIANIKTRTLAIAGVEIIDPKIKAIVNKLSPPSAQTNLAASQQLYQTVFQLRAFARSTSGVPGRRDAAPPDSRGVISPEDLEILRDFNLEALVSSDHASMSRGMEGIECQPDEDAPSEDLICQLTEEIRDVTIPAKIVNARKGDIILAPGGPGGSIGGLLQALTPPQWYSHCGIMEQSYYRIYHCTTSEDWLKDHPVGKDLPLDGEDTLPLFGFNPEAVQYAWPGTVSQTVQEAFDGSWMKENSILPEDLENLVPGKYWPKEYKIKAFSLQTIFPDIDHPLIDKEGNKYTWDNGRVNFPPLVVTVPPEAEAKNPELRQILRRVADQCLKIKGHYAFYAYSDADIAFKSAHFAPVREGWWASGSRPLVCSTLIWAAIRELFAGRGILEGKNEIVSDQDLEPEDRLRKIKVWVNGQEKEIAIDMGGMVDDLSRPVEHITKDGLYFYTEDERKMAAIYFSEKLKNDIYEKYNKSFLDLGWAIEAFTGMAKNVSNQMTNSFANGIPDPISQKWRNPGTGRSVSPDNIRDYWDRPVILPDGSLHGLYGHYEPLIYRPGRIEQMQVSRWKKKPATKGKIIVRVWFNNAPVEGATLTIPDVVDAIGKKPQTNVNGTFEAETYTGSCWIGAEKTINNQVYAVRLRLLNLQAGEVRQIDLHLSKTKRTLYYFAHAEINDYETIGSDEHVGRDWGTEAAPKWVNLDAYNPYVPASAQWTEKMGDEIRLEVPFNFYIRYDLHIVVKFRALFYEGSSEDTDDLDGSTDWIELVIPPDDNFYTMFPPPDYGDLIVRNTEEYQTEDYAKIRFFFKNMVTTY